MHSAKLASPPIAFRKSDVWFLVQVTADGGEAEVVFQSRPYSGVTYQAGSAELTDVLLGAVEAAVREFPNRIPKPHVSDAFEAATLPAGAEPVDTASLTFELHVAIGELLS